MYTKKQPTKIVISYGRQNILDGVGLMDVDPETFCDQWCEHLRLALSQLYPNCEIEIDWTWDGTQSEIEVYADEESLEYEYASPYETWASTIFHDTQDAWSTFQAV